MDPHVPASVALHKQRGTFTVGQYSSEPHLLYYMPLTLFGGGMKERRRRRKNPLCINTDIQLFKEDINTKTNTAIAPADPPLLFSAAKTRRFNPEAASIIVW